MVTELYEMKQRIMRYVTLVHQIKNLSYGGGGGLGVGIQLSATPTLCLMFRWKCIVINSYNKTN